MNTQVINNNIYSVNTGIATPSILTCAVHKEPIKGICLFHENCFDRLLCRKCRQLHDNSHLNYYEELDDIFNGSLVNDLADELSKSINKIDNQNFNAQKTNQAFINQVDQCFQQILEDINQRLIEAKAMIINTANLKIENNNKLKEKLLLAVNDINHIYGNAVIAKFQPVYVLEDLIQIICDNIKYKNSISGSSNGNHDDGINAKDYNFNDVNIQNIFQHTKISHEKIMEQILSSFNIPLEKTPHKQIKKSVDHNYDLDQNSKKDYYKSDDYLSNKQTILKEKSMSKTHQNNNFNIHQQQPSGYNQNISATNQPEKISISKELEKGPEILSKKTTIKTNHRQIMHGGLAAMNQGKVLITAGSDGFIKIWDCKNGALLKSFKAHETEIFKVYCIEERGLLLTASGDGLIKVWNIDDTSKVFKIYKAHKGPVYSMEYLYDLKLIASGGEDEILRIWDIEKLQETHLIKSNDGKIGSIAYFKSVKKIAVGYQNGIINIFNIAKNQSKLMYKLNGHNNYVLTLTAIEAISSLVSGSDDGSIKIWKLEESKGVCYRELRKEGTLIRSIAVFEDKDLLVSAHVDNYLRIWKISSGENIKTYSHEHPGETVVRLNNNMIASGNKNEITLWDFKEVQGFSHLIQ